VSTPTQFEHFENPELTPIKGFSSDVTKLDLKFWSKKLPMNLLLKIIAKMKYNHDSGLADDLNGKPGDFNFFPKNQDAL
jgi:hypothetical protein